MQQKTNTIHAAAPLPLFCANSSAALGTTGKSVITPTMRLQGLNQANNKTHPAASAASPQPVYATASGDLVIGRRFQVIKQTHPEQTC